MECPTLNLTHFIGKKWSVVLLEEIALGKFSGFNKTLQKSGLTPKILSSQLKEMEKLKLIKKTNSKPANYNLTERGTEIRKIVNQIKLFNNRWDNIEICRDKSCLECDKF